MDILGLDTTAETITWWHMSARAVVVFIATIFFIRVAGMRTFGFSSAFDVVITIVMGAVLSRAITGNSAFFPSLAASLTMCAFHRLLSYISFYSEGFGSLIKSRKLLLIEKGVCHIKNMKKASISEQDLLKALRQNGKVTSWTEVELAYFESDGTISVIPAKKGY